MKKKHLPVILIIFIIIAISLVIIFQQIPKKPSVIEFSEKDSRLKLVASGGYYVYEKEFNNHVYFRYPFPSSDKGLIINSTSIYEVENLSEEYSRSKVPKTPFYTYYNGKYYKVEFDGKHDHSLYELNEDWNKVLDIGSWSYVSDIAVYDDKLFISTMNDYLFYFDGNNISKIEGDDFRNINILGANEDYLFFFKENSQCNLFSYNGFETKCIYEFPENFPNIQFIPIQKRIIIIDRDESVIKSLDYESNSLTLIRNDTKNSYFDYTIYKDKFFIYRYSIDSNTVKIYDSKKVMQMNFPSNFRIRKIFFIDDKMYLAVHYSINESTIMDSYYTLDYNF
jgi:hypothetical protein